MPSLVVIGSQIKAKQGRGEAAYMVPKDLSLNRVKGQLQLFHFRLGHHDNNENFINLFIMPHSKCLPSFKTLFAQITKIAQVISYFI